MRTKGRPMKFFTALLVAVAIMMSGSFCAPADDIKIVANSSVRPDSITLTGLRRVFLEGKRSLSDGSHVEPVLAKSGAAHEMFLRQYIGKSDDELRTFYRTLVFTGTGCHAEVSDVRLRDHPLCGQNQRGHRICERRISLRGSQGPHPLADWSQRRTS